MSTTTPTTMSSPLLPDARLLAKGLAALRIFVGLIALLNGLAKLFGFRGIEIGTYKANLINLDETRQILTLEANKRGGTGTEIPGLKSLVNDVILAHYSVAEVLITAAEIGVGLSAGPRHRHASRCPGRSRPARVPGAAVHLEQPLAVRAAARVGAAPDPCARPGRPHVGPGRTRRGPATRAAEVAVLSTAPDGAAPLGSRLWLYTNFDCNLACSYCCAGSSHVNDEAAICAARFAAGPANRRVGRGV